MKKIEELKARQILDSRGNFTTEVLVITKDGKFKASSPSGASVGKREAVEIRDKNGKVLSCVSNINEIIYPAIKDLNILDQEKFDKKLIELDKTENKSNLGANSLLPVSIAVLKASAAHYNIPLYRHIQNLYNKKEGSFPLPCFNIINGGSHAGNNLDIQEFMVIPQKENYKENLEEGALIYQNLKKELVKKYGKGAINVGDEGGFSPPILSSVHALDIISSIIKKDTKIGLDCAASYFYKNKEYHLENNVFTRDGLLKFYLDLIKSYPIFSMEDPFEEEDIEGFRALKKEAKKTLIIGDDLTVTNKSLISFAAEEDLIGGVIIKPNQIGTVYETMEAIREAKDKGLKIMISHRSGETMDDFIADLSVGISSDYIKTGAPARGERVVKYNRLLEIYQEIN
ncbi:MAG: enolase [Candidatus Paceibacterota bacterium]|jgi:enolase|nr:enolase [Candidatus Paceibacterota bacterium]MDD4467274.1 enolase [Candidatus Paceibacterota bacterium]